MPTPRIRSRTRRRSPTSSRCSPSSPSAAALTYYLGRMAKNQAHGWSVWAAMMVLFLAGVLAVLVGGSRGQSDSPAARRRRRRRQHGGQGSALRHLQLRALRHHHHRRLLRRGQLDARLLHRARRSRAAVQHAARRNHHRRRRRGALRHARLRRARGLHRRPDGRAHAGVSRQEDPGLRGEDGDALAAGALPVHPRLHRLGGR